jgi:hypothetical protein
VVHLDLMDGQAVAWQRLRKALKRPGEEPPSESKGLLSRLGDVQVQDGQLRAKVLGKAVWLAGRDVDVVGITAALSADTVEISAQLPDVLGGGKAQAKGLLAQGKPAALEVQFVPLARYKAPELLRERLPKDLALQWAGARWEPKGGPAVTGLELIDLAEPATRILAVAAVSLPAQVTAGEQRLEARDVELNVPKARLEQALKALMPQGLPAEATPIVAALDRTRAVLPQVTAVRRSQATGESWSIEILRSNGTLGDAAWSIASVTAAIGPKAEGVPREMKFAVDAPVLRVPRLSKLIRHPQLQAAIDQGVTLRKVAEPQPEFDDEDEELDPRHRSAAAQAQGRRGSPCGQAAAARGRAPPAALDPPGQGRPCRALGSAQDPGIALVPLWLAQGHPADGATRPLGAAGRGRCGAAGRARRLSGRAGAGRSGQSRRRTL